MRRAIFLMAVTACAQSNWPAQLETDIKTQSWDAAVRVGAAILDEIEAGRMFTRFADVPDEINVRNLYATALDHAGNPDQARRQRLTAQLLETQPDAAGIAAQFARRIANLKADVLATQINQPAKFQHDGAHAQVIAFWATWCAPCKPELDRLARYRNPRAKLVTLDVDHLDPALRPYVQLESLQSPDLPQLYIVDPAGNIRFHITGFDDDRYFTNKLDWMIEAALTPPAPAVPGPPR